MANRTKKRKNRILTSLVTGFAVMLFIFEQSPANEAIRAWIGFKVLDATHSALLVGLAVGIITLIVELASSIFIALALNYSSKFKQFSQKFGNSKEVSATENSGSDYALALGVGAGTLVLKKHLKNRRQSLRADIVTAWKASLAITLFSVFIAFLAGGGIELAQQYGLGTPAQYFLGLATDWRFWLVVVIATQVVDLVKWRKK